MSKYHEPHPFERWGLNQGTCAGCGQIESNAIHVTVVNGAAVIRVERVDWRPGDDVHEMHMSRVIGRATVDVEGGGRFNGLVLSVWPNHLRRVVVVWEKTTDRFACIPVLP